MKNIKTFEDACAALKLDPAALPVVTGLPEKHQKAIQAHYKLVIIAEALNDGWKPIWKDWEECKYYPWFQMDSDDDEVPGSGFSYYVYRYDDAFACVGSRLCFKTRALAEYAGKQFSSLYKDYFLIQS